MPASEPKTAVVTGATGVQGRALLEVLDHRDEWSDIVAISRRPLNFTSRAQHLRLDLTDKDAVTQAFRKVKMNLASQVYLFHLAFSGDMTNVDRSVAEMLRNTVEGLEQVNSPLKHVYFTLGTKQYGVHWGETKSPFDESDPRHLPPNYYYDLEDYAIRRRLDGAPWTWSSLRPGPIIGYSLGTAMNLLHVIATYGAVCKELGIAMRFPGNAKAYHAIQECVDARLLMKAAIYTSTHSEAKNNSFNINNGDVFRWEHVWPKIAEWFDNETGPPLKIPLSVLMPKNADVWAALQEKHGLKIRVPLHEAASFEFGEAQFSMGFDAFSNTVKIRQAGFDNHVDTAANFIARFEELVYKGFIPRYGTKHHLPAQPDRILVKTQAQPGGIMSPPGSPGSPK